MIDHNENAGVGETIFTSLKKFKDRILLYDTDNDKPITFSDMLSQSVRTALKLKQKGITRNDIIGICSHNQQYCWAPVIATQFLGAISVYFEPNLSPVEVEHFLKLLQPKMIFVTEETLCKMENCVANTCAATELVVYGKSTKHNQFIEFIQENNEEQLFLPVEISNVEDTAIMLFSSGTTGLPKAICLNHRSVVHFGKSYPGFCITNKNPPLSLTFCTLFWITSYVNFISCITNGYATVVCKEFDPEIAWTLIEKLKVTKLFLAPYTARDLLDKKPPDVDVSSLEIIMIAGSVLSPKLLKDFWERLPNAKTLNIYSQTEFGDMPSMFNPILEEEYNMQILKPRSSGKLKHYVEWKFVDTDSEETLGPNQRGELRIKSPYLMTGYHKMDWSMVYDSDGFLKSGDVGYYDEDDCIYIVDRVREMCKYRSIHIIPVIIEEILRSHPAVKEAVVLGIPHELDGDHPMGVVTLVNGFNDTIADEILNFANGKLTDFQKLRAGIKIVDSIPVTPTGKIKRNVLKLFFSEKTNK